MSREELALETQLLLQEVTHASQFNVVAESDSTDTPGPLLSEYEIAKQALVDKLRKKKEQNRQQLAQVNMQRYGFAGTVPVASVPSPSTSRSVPTKHKLPVGSILNRVPTNKKRELLSKLRQQAIKQGMLSNIVGMNVGILIFVGNRV